jgi:hypothetical protein
MHRRQLPRAEQTGSADGDNPQRLIRLINELRALDLERRRQPVTSPSFRELVRRMEAKAREVFEEASGRPSPSVEADRESQRHVTH